MLGAEQAHWGPLGPVVQFDAPGQHPATPHDCSSVQQVGPLSPSRQSGSLAEQQTLLHKIGESSAQHIVLPAATEHFCPSAQQTVLSPQGTSQQLAPPSGAEMHAPVTHDVDVQLASGLADD